MFHRQPRLCLLLSAELSTVKSHPGETGFEGTKGSWRAADAGHCVAGLEPLKRAQERIFVKVQPNAARNAVIFGDTTIIGDHEQPRPRTAAEVKWNHPEHRRQAVCEAGDKAGEMIQASSSLENGE